MPEAVAKSLGLGGAFLGDGRLERETVDEPADDRAHGELEAKRERDVVEREARRSETVAPPPLGCHENRRLRRGHHQSSAQAVTKRGLDDRKEEELPDRRPGFEREDERVRPDHRRVEDKTAEAERRLETGLHAAPSDKEERDRTDRQHRSRRCRAGLVPSGRVLAEERDLGHRPRQRDQADERDPALELPATTTFLVRHASPLRRSSAHSACSRRSGSPPSACAWRADRCSWIPRFPAATSAFRRR